MNPQKTTETFETIVVRENLTLEAGKTYHARLVVMASHIVIQGNGAELVGPAVPGDRESYENAGIAIQADGCNNVRVLNVKAHGFATGMVLKDCAGWSVEGCDFSDNYTNPDFGWGELPSRGGILLTGVKWSVFRGNTAKNVWDGIHLRDSDDNLIIGNKFHHCTNVCAKLWNSSRNVFIENDLSYGIRIDREAGEVHARDSSSVLIESGSNNNMWYRNDVRGGGDGFFIRPLNGWLSTHNLFIENDASQGNNNCFEAWSPDNVYLRNLANEGSYGFWLGGSDGTVLWGNEASRNGRPEGNHNAPEPLFGHGGIVIVGGTASGVLVEGNRCEDNNGGGIVARGDVRRDPPRFVFENWVVQGNHLNGNKWPIHAQKGRGLFVAGNQGQSAEDDSTQDIEGMDRGTGEGLAPVVRMAVPQRSDLGRSVTLFAKDSRDPEGEALQFIWWVGGQRMEGAEVEWTPTQAGQYDVQLQVRNRARASAAWGSILIVEPEIAEVGTELASSQWQSHGPEAIDFWDDPAAVAGRYSLGMTTKPNPEGLTWAVLPVEASKPNLRAISFWMKYQNTNVFSWQNEAILVTLKAAGGELVWKGAPDTLPGYVALGSHRRDWFRFTLSVQNEDPLWRHEVVGNPDLSQIQSLSFAFDSTGEDCFHVWLDGLALIGE